MTDFNDDLPLPDISETQIADASSQKKLGPTSVKQTYKWRIVSGSKDVSDPETSGKGWMMLVFEANALRPPTGDGADWLPTRFKQKKWLCLPRTPSKAILLKKGYTEEVINALLGTPGDPATGAPGTPGSFNPNGKDDFIYTSFARFVRAIFPETFPRVAGWDRVAKTWIAYNADGTTSNLGSGDEGKAAAKKLLAGQTAAILTVAGNLWAAPDSVKGLEFYDGYVYKENDEGGRADFGEFAGYPSAGPGQYKDGAGWSTKTVVDPTTNVLRD